MRSAVDLSRRSFIRRKFVATRFIALNEKKVIDKCSAGMREKGWRESRRPVFAQQKLSSLSREERYGTGEAVAGREETRSEEVQR